jgi:MFS family permease
MPIIAGVLIGRYNFNLVFIIAMLFYGATLIPYMTLPRTHEKFSWGVIETFKKFIKTTNRKIVLSNMANGAESGVALIIWPIFIWDLLSGDFLAVGAISSFIVLITVVLQLIAGKYTDKFNKRNMIKWGSSLYALGWIMKIFVITSYQIFLVGAYHNLVKIFKDTPFDALLYDVMADYGHYVDEHTVLKEMAVHLGRTLILVFAIFVALGFGLNWTFILAALASLFINLL